MKEAEHFFTDILRLKIAVVLVLSNNNSSITSSKPASFVTGTGFESVFGTCQKSTDRSTALPNVNHHTVRPPCTVLGRAAATVER